MKDPLKQGLKPISFLPELPLFGFVEVKDPLKQGLKLKILMVNMSIGMS